MFDGVTIGDIKYISGTIIPDPSANITIDVHVSVKNPNFVSFRYDNGTTTLFYHETKVGEGKTPAGVVNARRTRRMNLSLKMVTARMLEEKALGSEIRSGAMIMSSYTNLNGRVKILGAFKKRESKQNQADKPPRIDITKGIQEGMVGDSITMVHRSPDVPEHPHHSGCWTIVIGTGGGRLDGLGASSIRGGCRVLLGVTIFLPICIILRCFGDFCGGDQCND
ncbi:hypothetical protein Sjap_005166 [Stephania japonica]|uniref:Late embryogenesis abundant protein LEA-2 subgroup domain-containing protein n=1 Tax=Stephania japonica TaxID=461633 RepID=A0AAP0K532_9MAGN